METFRALAVALVCTWYGLGHLGRETAFASWWDKPAIPLTVRDSSLKGLAPGTWVRLTVMDLPSWAWPGLREEMIGKSVLAVVADRPGGCDCDMWPETFRRLSGGRLWVGRLEVEVSLWSVRAGPSPRSVFLLNAGGADQPLPQNSVFAEGRTY